MIMQSEAVGLLEVYGLVTAFAAADAACKAANVTIEAFDRNRPANADAEIPLIMLVKLRGGIADVRAALDAGEAAANQIGGVILRHMIAKLEEGSELVLGISAL